MKTSEDPTRSSTTTTDAAAAEPAAAVDSGGVADKIAEEHRALRQVLARVEKATDLHRLLALLAELRRLLVPHFASEEDDEGFERLLGRRAPHLLSDLDEVLDEHGELLADVDRVAAAARACLDGPVAEVRRQAAELAARLHAHEERETALLVGAVYDDLGTPS